MSYLWQVILYAKHVHLRCVPAALQYQVMDRSLHNTDTYYPYIEKWVLMCEPYLLQRMDAKVTWWLCNYKPLQTDHLIVTSLSMHPSLLYWILAVLIVSHDKLMMFGVWKLKGTVLHTRFSKFWPWGQFFCVLFCIFDAINHIQINSFVFSRRKFEIYDVGYHQTVVN